jgi:ketosteroid isomerase-like protein
MPGEPMDSERLAYFAALYDAFNARDADAVLARTTDDVDWPNAWEGGRLRGQDAVRDYWTRQWREIDPRVEPLAVEVRGDRTVAVTVRQEVRSRDGQPLSTGEVLHVYTLRDRPSGGELIERMDVEEPI